MPDLHFPWIFIALASIIDVVGLFYLWRRRRSASKLGYRRPRRTPPVFLADRRRNERRGTGPAARGAGSIPA